MSILHSPVSIIIMWDGVCSIRVFIGHHIRLHGSLHAYIIICVYIAVASY